MNVTWRTPNTLVFAGDLDAAVDSTAGQYIKVSGADEGTPCDDPDDNSVGILAADTAAGAKMTVISGCGLLEFESIGGSPAVGDQIEIGVDGYPTKLTTGPARGVIYRGSDGAWEVLLYSGKGVVA